MICFNNERWGNKSDFSKMAMCGLKDTQTNTFINAERQLLSILTVTALG